MSWPPPVSPHASTVRPGNWFADSAWIVAYALRLPGGGLVVGGVVVGGVVVGGVVVGGVVVGGVVVGGVVVGGPVVGGGPPGACGELAALAPPDHTAT